MKVKLWEVTLGFILLVLWAFSVFVSNDENSVIPSSTVAPSQAQSQIIPFQGGIRGNVMERNKPFPTEVFVHQDEGVLVVSQNTKPDGTFSFDLPPGVYTVSAATDESFCSMVRATVQPTDYTIVFITCD